MSRVCVLDRSLSCSAGMPEGELRVHDVDGYCLIIGQLGLSFY